jgi:hypothetical protein
MALRGLAGPLEGRTPGRGARGSAAIAKRLIFLATETPYAAATSTELYPGD